MNNRETVAIIMTLAQLAVDAMLAYDIAMSNVSEASLRARLSGWRAEHEWRLRELAVLIRNHGGAPPEYSRDFTGFLIPGMTEIEAGAALRPTMLALLRNEWLALATYDQALKRVLPHRVAAEVRAQRMSARRMAEEVAVCIELHVQDAGKDRTASAAAGP